jgi:hypothetical protein
MSQTEIHRHRPGPWLIAFAKPAGCRRLASMSADRYQQHVFEMEAALLYLRPHDFLDLEYRQTALIGANFGIQRSGKRAK